jgi:hypothetical protein
VTFFAEAVIAKQLELLHELLPQATAISVLVNPNFPGATFQLRDVQEAARTLGHTMHVLNASTGSEINTAFATMAQQRADALLAAGDPFFGCRSLSHLQRAMLCSRFTHSANTSRAAALLVTEPATREKPGTNGRG